MTKINYLILHSLSSTQLDKTFAQRIKMQLPNNLCIIYLITFVISSTVAQQTAPGSIAFQQPPILPTKPPQIAVPRNSLTASGPSSTFQPPASPATSESAPPSPGPTPIPLSSSTPSTVAPSEPPTSVAPSTVATSGAPSTAGPSRSSTAASTTTTTTSSSSTSSSATTTAALSSTTASPVSQSTTAAPIAALTPPQLPSLPPTLSFQNRSRSQDSAASGVGFQKLKPKIKFKCLQDSDCLHGGVCRNSVCFCPPGYSGESCAINIDECRQEVEPCANNGTCFDLVNDFRCECAPGFKGDRCLEPIDLCADSPCLNGAKCLNHRTDFSCECSPGWEGKLCELNINECLRNPCQNNATCLDEINDYKCECEPGWEGRHCELNIDECLRNPCKNNATCVDLINGYRCDCAPGFTGDRCLDPVDMCASLPCSNGAKCINHQTDYSCECELGWEGRNCDININECLPSNPCQNNATCEDLINDYRCDCGHSGFTGKNCELDIDECASRPCAEGAKECLDAVGDFKCICHEGYTGKRCDIDIDECQPVRFHCDVENGDCEKQRDLNTCIKGQGICENLDGSFRCNCKDGYKGKNCEEIADYCKAKQPCANGLCKNVDSAQGKYHCECPSSHVGKKCDRKRDCSPGDCHRDHAHCVNNVTCACLPGRREDRMMCEYPESCEQIDGELCLNGGQCKNLEHGGYHCQCVEPFYGPICQYLMEKPQFDALLVIVVSCVGILIVACAIVSLVIFRSVRKARATRGTYSPSTQEKFGNSASELLKTPQRERLI